MLRVAVFLFALILFVSVKFFAFSGDYGKVNIEAGAASADITPRILETFTDCNKNGTFDGNFRKPGCNPQCNPEVPCDNFEDKNRNKTFDAVWMAGYGKSRPATGVHDPLYARAVALKQGDEFVVLVALDVVGFSLVRVNEIRSILEKERIPKGRLIVSSIHNHEGPDTMGLWGPDMTTSGVNPDYQEFLVKTVVKIVLEALKNVQPASLKLAKVRMRDVDPYYTGIPFGGKNPKETQVGLLNDIRDPVIVDDTLYVMKADDRKGKTIVTLLNWSGHVEVVGDENTLLSADYVGYFRNYVEKYFGGAAIFFPSDVGGMMSSLGGKIPLVYEKGKRVYGENRVPVYAQNNSFEVARSLGFLLADAGVSSIKKSSYEKNVRLKALSSEIQIPFENFYFLLAAGMNIIEMDPKLLLRDKKCGKAGCLEETLTAFSVGDSQFVTVPGELFPELAVGVPEDDAFVSPRPNKYFPQHDVSDFKTQHADPYVVESPVRSAMRANHQFIIGLANTEFGYIVPASDFRFYGLWNHGDHYEESMSLGPRVAPVVSDGVLNLLGML